MIMIVETTGHSDELARRCLGKGEQSEEEPPSIKLQTIRAYNQISNCTYRIQNYYLISVTKSNEYNTLYVTKYIYKNTLFITKTTIFALSIIPYSNEYRTKCICKAY
jgi:hypothetical protein